jgi:jumonji domain-containing protein 7
MLDLESCLMRNAYVVDATTFVGTENLFGRNPGALLPTFDAILPITRYYVLFIDYKVHDGIFRDAMMRLMHLFTTNVIDAFTIQELSACIGRKNGMTTSRPLFEVDENAMESFVDDVQYLWCSSSRDRIDECPIAILDEPPSALEFLRDYVSVSRPCIIRNAVSFRCTVSDLVHRCPQMELVVDVSPDGHADVLRCVQIPAKEEDKPISADGSVSKSDGIRTIFVQPEQRCMTIESFHKQLIHQNNQRIKHKRSYYSLREPCSRVFQIIEKQLAKEENGNNPSSEETLEDESVFYYSRQNDCLRQELTEFWKSSTATHDTNRLPRTFAWAEEAFGTGPPQAVNLWIGNECSVSSMHKDHYENLFYVASGEKVFTLCPPADSPFLYEQECDSGRFYWDADRQEWMVQLDEDAHDNTGVDVRDTATAPLRTRWIAADVTMKHNVEYLQAFPLLKYTHPVEVRVKEGELLYLPALWFHRVTQTLETVGVNYWYDMKFESPIWTFFHLLQQFRSVT